VWSCTHESAVDLGVFIGLIEFGASEVKGGSEFDAAALSSSVIGSELFGMGGVIGEVPTPWVMGR
jgi:hypothetical protein